jgi:hypothetical protein
MAIWEEDWYISDEYPEHVTVQFQVIDVEFRWWTGAPLYEWLNSDDAAGFFSLRQGIADADGYCVMTFLFSDPNTAFEFKIRREP